MTFLEAAIEVLRREGKPLQVRRLAELAVQHNLLSVVGRDPEATMQARLDEVLDKGPTNGDLLRIPPGLYGLRAYPPRPYPPPREVSADDAANAADDVAAEDDEPLAAPGAAPPDAAGDEGRKRRRRRRGGRGGERAPGGEHGGAPRPVGDVVTAAPEAMSAAAEGDELVDDGEESEFEVGGDGSSSAPLMVTTAGDEEITRSGEEREVRSEILGGRREERGRHRKDRGRGRDQGRGARPEGQRTEGPRHEGPRHEGPRHEGPRHEGPRPAQHAAPSGPAPSYTPVGARRNLADDLVELLRANDARPQHVRALAQEAERKKILDGRPQPEIVREVRMALHGETTSRAARGLRPRVRSLGGGNYAVVDRKLDDDLVAAERGLEAALDRLTAATAGALRRKLSRLSPFSFEQLGRTVSECLGVERPTLVKRGDGVAYFGGERQNGAVRSRVLIGVRTGEADLGRRAVGELRAGLDARGFDEGLLLGLGRLGAEGKEELRAGRAVTVYDGDSLPTLLVNRRLGVRISHATVAHLDLDFFTEINET